MLSSDWIVPVQKVADDVWQLGRRRDLFFLLSGLLDLVINIRAISSTGMKRFIATVDSSILLHLIESSVGVKESDQVLITIFQGLLDAKITSFRVLESLNAKDLSKDSMIILSQVRNNFAG